VVTKGTQEATATLGDVLYAKSKAPVPEREWVTLVQSIASGDQLALHALYERARIGFMLQPVRHVTVPVRDHAIGRNNGVPFNY
jgi:hypothetical protein